MFQARSQLCVAPIESTARGLCVRLYACNSFRTAERIFTFDFKEFYQILSTSARFGKDRTPITDNVYKKTCLFRAELGGKSPAGELPDNLQRSKFKLWRTSLGDIVDSVLAAGPN
jgi:hypothetical protein